MGYNMRIYVDFDDVISETALYFTFLVKRLFGKDISYDDIRFFNLQKSFDLTDSEYEYMMEVAHRDEELASYKETEGASVILNKWISDGHTVEIVTGRPFSSARATKLWLNNHGLKNLKVIHVDKYGREQPLSRGDIECALTVDEFAKLHYDFAVEDSPLGLEHLKRIEGCKVAVYDRPWNQTVQLEENSSRCKSWNEIDDMFSALRQ